MGPNPTETTLPVYTLGERTEDSQERSLGGNRQKEKTDEVEESAQRNMFVCIKAKNGGKAGNENVVTKCLQQLLCTALFCSRAVY